MTIVYYTRPRQRREPTAAEVLASLIKDANAYGHAPGFVEFCAAFGHLRDRRRSEWTYVACRDAAARLHHLLGEDYAVLAGVVLTIR
jgi:hypothetical protein